MEGKFGSLTIEIKQGDITNETTDAIVNAANNHLWMGSGVAGAIKRKGGQQIEKEAVAKGPIPIGGAVETTAGDLPIKYVIHAAAMGQDLQTDATKISEATCHSLQIASKLGLESIAFPALGTGVGGFDADDAAEIMISEAIAHGEGTGTGDLALVVFVLFDDRSTKAFKRVLQGKIDA